MHEVCKRNKYDRTNFEFGQRVRMKSILLMNVWGGKPPDLNISCLHFEVKIFNVKDSGVQMRKIIETYEYAYLPTYAFNSEAGYSKGSLPIPQRTTFKHVLVVTDRVGLGTSFDIRHVGVKTSFHLVCQLQAIVQA